MNVRTAVVAVALAFGVWEAIDTLDTGVPALVFSVLFLVAAAWLVRRPSRAAAIFVALLCAVEASQAHTWKDAGPAAKDTAMVLGSLGILTAFAFVASRIHSKGATR